jgi:hypothetical protein
VSVPITKKAMNCSLLATFHQARQRRMLPSVGRNVTPVAGAASSSPVIGDTIRGA